MRASRPSRSATKVGQAVIYLAGDERYGALLPPDLGAAAERLLTAAGAWKPWQSRLASRPWYRRFVAWMERRTVPGHVLHLGLRKRLVQDEVETAIEDGVAQLAVVGAGMDTLCLRLAERFPRTRFVEVDHPASQRLKRRAVEKLGEPPPNLHFLAADLASTPLDEALTSLPAWAGGERSLVVAEGVLMYLAAATVEAFFDAVHRATGPASLLLFSYVRRDAAGRLELGKLSRLVRLGQSATGEPLTWGVAEGELAPLLEAHGFRLAGPPERFDLRRRYLEPAGLGDEPLGTIEGFALARRLD
jgi:methyltransferase (TIGR00027 family)